MSHVKHKVKASCHEADCGIARREHILIPFFMCANTSLDLERCLRTLRCRLPGEMMSWWRHRHRGRATEQDIGIGLSGAKDDNKCA